MKKTFFLMILTSVLAVNALAQDTNSPKKDPAGKWKFEAPYAPEGYNTGLMNFGFADNKYFAETSFTGSEYKIPGEKVRVVNDSVSFVIYLEGQSIKVSLKIDEPGKMSGNAIYSEGTVPLTLKRENGTVSITGGSR